MIFIFRVSPLTYDFFSPVLIFPGCLCGAVHEEKGFGVQQLLAVLNDVRLQFGGTGGSRSHHWGLSDSEMKNSNHPLLFLLLSFLVPSAFWRYSHPGRFFKTFHIPVIFISYYKSFFTFPQKNMTRVRRQKLSNDVFQYKKNPKNEVKQKKRNVHSP